MHLCINMNAVWQRTAVLWLSFNHLRRTKGLSSCAESIASSAATSVPQRISCLGMLRRSCTGLQVTSNMRGRGGAMMRSRYFRQVLQTPIKPALPAITSRLLALLKATMIRAQRLLQKPDAELHVGRQSRQFQPSSCECTTTEQLGSRALETT